MRLTRQISILATISLLTCFQGMSVGQESDLPPLHQDFSVATKIGLSFSGTHVTTEFKLTDELGLEYDVMSLVNDSQIRDAIQLTPGQLDEMRQLSSAATTELTAQLASQLLSDDPKSGLEEAFLDVENQLHNVLSVDQDVLLDQARVQRGVDRFGIAKYLATNSMRSLMDLTGEDVDSISARASELTTRRSAKEKSLIEKANLELLNTLSPGQRARFDNRLADSMRATYLSSRLFVSNKSLKRRTESAKRPQLKLLRRNSIKKQLKLSEPQRESIADLVKTSRGMSSQEIQRTINEILTPSQDQQLARIGCMEQIKRFGTVNALSYGILSGELQLSNDESSRLYSTGKKISSDLLTEIETLKTEALVKSLDSLANNKRDRVLKLIETSLPVD